MNQFQDRVNSDLVRFMSNEPQDNIDDIRITVKKRLVVTDSIKIVPLTCKNRKDDLFSSGLNKKISRVRPEYIVRLVGLLLCGYVFTWFDPFLGVFHNLCQVVHLFVLPRHYA